MSYEQMIENIDQQIVRLNTAKAALVALVLPTVKAAPKASSTPRTKGRAKVGGGDEVVLSVIRDGAETIKAITAQAKVKPYVALCAVKRLVAAKKVKAEGATSTRRYVIA